MSLDPFGPPWLACAGPDPSSLDVHVCLLAELLEGLTTKQVPKGLICEVSLDLDRSSRHLVVGIEDLAALVVQSRSVCFPVDGRLGESPVELWYPCLAMAVEHRVEHGRVLRVELAG